MKKAIIALLLLSGTALPVVAQQQQMTVEGRVGKLEKEMRAVQRKVFPGGAQQYFEPEIKPPVAPAAPVGVPADAPVADLIRRVDALEKALTQMTGQVEQNGYKVRQLEDQLTKMKGDTEFRLNAIEGKAPGATASAGASLPYSVPPAVAAPTVGSAAAAPAAVTAAVDPGRDAYLAGYALWEQKKYPEAIAALRAMYAKYPKHKDVSKARNLAGRAYLDSGDYKKAIVEFFENTKIEDGDRAPHSYVFMAQALMKLTPPDVKRACTAYEVLLYKYPDKVKDSLAKMVEKGKADAKCA